MSGSVLDFSTLRSAIESLADGLDVVGDAAWFPAQTPKVQNTLMAGVIQLFELVFETSIKMIKLRIALDGRSAADVDPPKFQNLLREALKAGLIHDVEAWIVYRRKRNITAHTYDCAEAMLIYGDILTFVADARALLSELEMRNA